MCVPTGFYFSERVNYILSNRLLKTYKLQPPIWYICTHLFVFDFSTLLETPSI